MPAINKYVGKLASNISVLAGIDGSINSSYQKRILNKLSENLAKIDEYTTSLTEKYHEESKYDDIENQAFFIKGDLLPLMAKLRCIIDECETLLPKD